MTTPVVTFFNNKGGVGKTTLVYHLAWMLRELGLSVVAVDLDPQANLTASFLNDDSVEKLWSQPRRLSTYGALEPLFRGTGGITNPHVEEIAPNLGLVPGDVLANLAKRGIAQLTKLIKTRLRRMRYQAGPIEGLLAGTLPDLTPLCNQQ